jgi:hypothetical protein
MWACTGLNLLSLTINAHRGAHARELSAEAGRVRLRALWNCTSALYWIGRV